MKDLIEKFAHLHIPGKKCHKRFNKSKNCSTSQNDGSLQNQPKSEYAEIFNIRKTGIGFIAMFIEDPPTHHS